MAGVAVLPHHTILVSFLVLLFVLFDVDVVEAVELVDQVVKTGIVTICL